jgi:hypothetical protein
MIHDFCGIELRLVDATDAVIVSVDMLRSGNPDEWCLRFLVEDVGDEDSQCVSFRLHPDQWKHLASHINLLTRMRHSEAECCRKEEKCSGSCS